MVQPCELKLPGVQGILHTIDIPADYIRRCSAEPGPQKTPSTGTDVRLFSNKRVNIARPPTRRAAAALVAAGEPLVLPSASAVVPFHGDDAAAAEATAALEQAACTGLLAATRVHGSPLLAATRVHCRPLHRTAGGGWVAQSIAQRDTKRPRDPQQTSARCPLPETFERRLLSETSSIRCTVPLISAPVLRPQNNKCPGFVPFAPRSTCDRRPRGPLDTRPRHPCGVRREARHDKTGVEIASASGAVESATSSGRDAPARSCSRPRIDP